MPKTRPERNKRIINYIEELSSVSSDDSDFNAVMKSKQRKEKQDLAATTSMYKNKRNSFPRKSPKKKHQSNLNYTEESSSDDSDLYVFRKSKQRKEKQDSAATTSKNKNKRNSFPRKSLKKNQQGQSTFSDDEIMAFQKTKENTIRTKIDSFFKDLDSDDDTEFNKQDVKESNMYVKPSNRVVYILSSDSESDPELSTPGNTSAKSVSEIKKQEHVDCDSIENASNDEKNDLLDFVDKILKEYDVESSCKGKVKENVLDNSFESLLKQSNEIIGSFSSYVDNSESNKEQQPEKEAPCCPVCLEALGGETKVMVTVCGHMFCEPCIVEVSKTVRKCPTCRKSVTKTKFHPIYI